MGKKRRKIGLKRAAQPWRESRILKDYLFSTTSTHTSHGQTLPVSPANEGGEPQFVRGPDVSAGHFKVEAPATQKGKNSETQHFITKREEKVGEECSKKREGKKLSPWGEKRKRKNEEAIRPSGTRKVDLNSRINR